MKKARILNFLASLVDLDGVDQSELALLRAYHEKIGSGRRKIYPDKKTGSTAHYAQLRAEADARGVTIKQIREERRAKKLIGQRTD